VWATFRNNSDTVDALVSELVDVMSKVAVRYPNVRRIVHCFCMIFWHIASHSGGWYPGGQGKVGEAIRQGTKIWFLLECVGLVFQLVHPHLPLIIC